MKTKLLPTTCLLVLLLIFSAGCRYEDGPVLSLRSKAGRIVGNKKIASYLIDGIDSTDRFMSAFRGTSYDSTGFEWLPDEDQRLIGCYPDCRLGYWELKDDGKTVYVELPSLRSGGPLFLEGIWEILRLTERELWLRIIANSKNHLIKFEKIKSR